MTTDELKALTDAIVLSHDITWYSAIVYAIGIFTISSYLVDYGYRLYRIYRLTSKPEYCSQCDCIDCIAESARRFEREEEGA